MCCWLTRYMRSVWKVPNHFKYFNYCLHGFNLICQPTTNGTNDVVLGINYNMSIGMTLNDLLPLSKTPNVKINTIPLQTYTTNNTSSEACKSFHAFSH